MKKILILGLASLAMGGCSQDNLYFGTGTSVGLDIVGTQASPISASLAYKRTEVTFSEQKMDQEPYSILGILDMSVDFWSGTRVDQHFATGTAAEFAAYTAMGMEKEEIKQKLLQDTQTQSCKPDDNEDKNFLFVTGSTIGVDLDFSKGDPHAVIGYKRVETAFVPVCKKNGTVGSVYSRMQFDSQADQSSRFFTNTGIKQSFATGKAAQILASRSSLGADAVKKIAPQNPQNVKKDQGTGN